MLILPNDYYNYSFVVKKFCYMYECLFAKTHKQKWPVGGLFSQQDVVVK
jgi:hypothetical protein